MPAEEAGKLPLHVILERVQEVVLADGTVSRAPGEAFLGGGGKPSVTVSEALETFWQLSNDRLLGKSPDQVTRWCNPRIKAVKNFISVVGDLPLKDVTADHMLDFRDWWWERIENKGLTTNSAEKDLTQLVNIFRTVCRMKRLGFEVPVKGLYFKETKRRTRPPMPVEAIKRIIESADLMKLNEEARTILLGIVNPGYRPREGAGLLLHHIHLDGEIL